MKGAAEHGEASESGQDGASAPVAPRQGPGGSLVGPLADDGARRPARVRLDGEGTGRLRKLAVTAGRLADGRERRGRSDDHA